MEYIQALYERVSVQGREDGDGRGGWGMRSAGRGSRYIRKYKSIQDGSTERCLACR